MRLLAALFCFAWMTTVGMADQRPNIVLIYADDLGYGDIGCQGAVGVRTPNIDRLAEQGLRMTNAFAPAATCTPSRYAMLTGQYAWRRSGTSILPGDAAAIIEPGRTTMASVLAEAGYKTGVVGKWHLGLGEGDLDWNGPIKPGPLEIGFHYCFLIPATGDRVPCVYVENHRVVGLDPDDPIEVSFREPVGDRPTGRDNPGLLKVHPSHGHDMTIINGISRIGYMSGGKAALWDDETMADVITGKAVDFINKHAEEPFFLYFSLHDIHVPRVAHERFVEKSEMGPRGDVIVQLDWCVGRIAEALDKAGVADDTLLIFTSDNGPVLDDGYKEQAVERVGEHKPAGPFRGGKYSIFEAGTRMPTIVRWPNRIKPGTSDALVGQVDFLATFAALVDRQLKEDEGPDSFNVLPAITGQSPEGRDHLVQQARVLALREGPWKYIEPGKGPAYSERVNIELGNSPEPQLYNLDDDPGETNNLADRMPDKVKQLQSRLDEIRDSGRSRD